MNLLLSRFKIYKHSYVRTFLLALLLLFFCGFRPVPEVKFIVFSDPHYYDPSLGVEGEAFKKYIENDRKLLKESKYIIERAIDIIAEKEADFIIVPGDLTKDGTLISHQKFAGYLKQLESQGKKVYVVPGNHDINNPESYGYEGEMKIKHENISPEDFNRIYHDYGYGEAIASDTASLSYVAEPVEGIWLLGMDACLYKNNPEKGHPITDGAFSDATLQWIEKQLDLAKAKNKQVIGFMHHGILEHYKKQNKFYGEYIVDDYKKVSKLFASKGMKLVFTGHYHAQDVVKKDYGKDGEIYDIETGSLVTYPCPVRFVELSDNQVKINSERIKKIETYPEGFSEYSKDYVWSGIEGIARRALISYKLDEDEAAKLSGQVADAFVAHYSGDEAEKDKPFNLEGISLRGRFLIGFKKKLVSSLWEDLKPADNEVVVEY